MEIIKAVPNQKIIKNLLIIFLSSLLITISAKIKIPFYPVPMTMQTFVVMLVGITFGWKIGVATISLYLFEGIIGFFKGIENKIFFCSTFGWYLETLLFSDKFLKKYLTILSSNE